MTVNRLFGQLMSSSAIGAILLAALVGNAAAQETAAAQKADEQSSDDVTVLDMIVIHGEKFARNPFNIFTSVEFVTSDELDDYVRQTLGEALNSSPNIRVSERSGLSSITIRGINAEGPAQPSRSNPVISVSVDGAEQSIEAMRAGTSGVWDVEQIEVLRGPQSTLQGRNALAGAVVIKTKDPTFTPEVILREEIDSNGLYSGAFAVSGPIIQDQLAFRLSGQVTRDDNDITYADSSYDSYGEKKFEEFRGKLLFTPSELPGFTALLTVSRTHDKPSNNIVNGEDIYDRVYQSTGYSEFRDTVVNRYIADLKYEINSDWAVQSVTSYVDTKVELTTPEGQESYYRDETRDRGDFSQDVRLTYGSDESDLSGVLGLYAGRSSGQGDSYSEYDLFGTGLIPFQDLDSETKNTSLAVYADGRYKFADRWTFLAGARLVHDKVSSDYDGVILEGTSYEATLDEATSKSNTEFLPRIGLAFELSENQNLALTASKGYRPGYDELITGTSTINDVEKETMWAYELAYRSKWLDDRLQITGNVFYYDYKNMQVDTPVPGLYGSAWTYTVNAEQAHSFGAELEARWNFDSGLEVFGGLGLMKTQFDEAEYNGESIAGNEFPDAPGVTASLGAIYKHHSGWFVGGDITYTDGYYSKGEVQNRSTGYVDPYTLVNAQAGYANEHFDFTLYAKNLLDEKYVTSTSTSGSNIGDARTFGLQLTQRF
ncbi:TonB-dependent receptor [Agrobacterium vitis]|uniref:TonB-dependent receptor n=1 Tax=Rhizobium/Agrobacterium group TaxID=227290 RepID=UPI0012E914D8|nr:MULTISPECIES: TonB-dependent receptor [Rhizobium/Agrobacterium group]MCF1494524.1 TonB-dependent receptor [Allorhizobium ampelinum]MVA46030.1 TonB-dependent receptor [Agrobacterium vitis]